MLSVVGNTARLAAVYDFKLRRAMLVGFRYQLRSDRLYEDGFIGLMEGRFESERVPVFHLTVCIEGASRHGWP